MSTAQAFRLTPEQYWILWSDLGLGNMPYPLDLPGTSTSAQWRADLWSALGSSRGHVEALLRLIGNHTVAVDVVADDHGVIRAMAATDGDQAVLAVIRDNAVELTEISPADVISSILDVLPRTDAGARQALTVPVATVRAAERAEEDDEEEADRPWGRQAESPERKALSRAGVSTADATLLGELITNRTAGGQLGVTCHAERSPEVITWFDTRSGRYLVVANDGWLQVTPASNAHITSRIETIISLAHKEGTRNG